MSVADRDSRCTEALPGGTSSRKYMGGNEGVTTGGPVQLLEERPRAHARMGVHKANPNW